MFIAVLTQQEPTLAVFLVAFIFLGLGMVAKAVMGKIPQNLELLLIGVAATLLGIVGIFGDTQIGGVSLRFGALVLLTIVILELVFMFLYYLEGK